MLILCHFVCWKTLLYRFIGGTNRRWMNTPPSTILAPISFHTCWFWDTIAPVSANPSDTTRRIFHTGGRAMHVTSEYQGYGVAFFDFCITFITPGCVRARASSLTFLHVRAADINQGWRWNSIDARAHPCLGVINNVLKMRKLCLAMQSSWVHCFGSFAAKLLKRKAFGALVTRHFP